MYRRSFFIRLSLSILLALSLLSACTTIRVGQDFDVNSFQEFVRQGESTQAEVLSKMGEPTSKGLVIEKDGSRFTRWVYYYASGQIHKPGNAKLKILEVFFDEQKKVSSYNWSE